MSELIARALSRLKIQRRRYGLCPLCRFFESFLSEQGDPEPRLHYSGRPTGIREDDRIRTTEDELHPDCSLCTQFAALMGGVQVSHYLHLLQSDSGIDCPVPYSERQYG